MDFLDNKFRNRNIITFMTDGEDSYPAAEIEKIDKNYKD
jgi:hypothetical protein